MAKRPKWGTLLTAADWQQAAETLLEQALEAATSGDQAAMSEVCEALGEFIQNRTLVCPDEAVNAVFGAHTELTRLIAADVVGSISSRTVQLKAYLDDIKRLAVRLERDARLIRLEPIEQVLTDVKQTVADLKALKKALTVGESPAELKARVDAVIAALTQTMDNIKSEMP